MSAETPHNSLAEIRAHIDRLDLEIGGLLAARDEYLKQAAKFDQSITLTDAPQHFQQVSTPAAPLFQQLTEGWNAEPNAPNPHSEIDGADLLLKFTVDAIQFPEFEQDEIAVLRFVNCTRYRLGPTNDEGWYRGRCRFSGLAPAWGEFYSIKGDRELLNAPQDWQPLGVDHASSQHFLFYFRDNTFECAADQCLIEPCADNALIRTEKKL